MDGVASWITSEYGTFSNESDFEPCCHWLDHPTLYFNYKFVMKVNKSM